MVRTDNDINGLSSVTPSTRVCSVSDSTMINGIQPQEPIARTTYSECVTALQNGQADAIYSDYALLLGYALEYPNTLKLINTKTSTQYYGIGLPLGDYALQLAINTLLNQAIANGTWRAIFNATLTPEGLQPTPPTVGVWPSSYMASASPRGLNPPRHPR